MKKTIFFVFIFSCIPIALLCQIFEQKVTEVFTPDYSWESKIMLDENPNKEVLHQIGNHIKGTWKYEGRYLNDNFIIDTTGQMFYPYQNIEIFTDTGIYVISFDDSDTSIERLNLVKTLTIVDFSEPNSYENAKLYEIDYDFDMGEFVLPTCRPFCTIGIYNKIWGVKIRGHFGGEWFRPFVKLNSDTLILKDAEFTKVYTQFEHNLMDE